MSTIQDILDAIAPQIPDDARRDLFIELASAELDQRTWGKLYSQGVANLVAHQITLQPAGGSSGLASGAIQKKKAGDEEIQYQQVRIDNINSLYSTTYGQEFLRLQKRAVPGFDWSNRLARV